MTSAAVSESEAPRRAILLRSSTEAEHVPTATILVPGAVEAVTYACGMRTMSQGLPEACLAIIVACGAAMLMTLSASAVSGTAMANA